MKLYIFIKNNNIRDNGLTELEPSTLTCVNYGIVDYAEISKHKILKRLQLVK